MSYTILEPLYAAAARNIRYAAQIANASLQSHSPLALITATALGIYTIQKLGEVLSRQKLAAWALAIPAIRKKYEAEILKAYFAFRTKTAERWKKFGDPIVKIPEEGMSYAALIERIEKFSKIVVDGLKEQHVSGTIYSDSLKKDRPPLSRVQPPNSDKLEELFAVAYKEANLWNSLHGKEFAVGPFLNSQVVQMAADLFGGKSDRVMGTVTSGGSESLMMAAMAYRNWGREVKGHRLGKSVILASDTAHAALKKAGIAHDIQIIEIPTGETGVLDIHAVNEAIEIHGDKVVALFLSAPNYPTGKIDPIREIARKRNFGIHVDCCLGGFLLDNHDSNYLTMAGVTSLSADVHKNGQCPKGASVLVTQAMPNGENLFHYAIFVDPYWKGGLYGTPRNGGSQSCVPEITAFIAMLAIGKKGYRENSQKIRQKTQELAQAIDSSDALRLIVQPDLNVVTFKVAEKHKLDFGATYVFAQEMEQRKFTLNTIQGDAVHYCMTARDANNPTFIAAFKTAAQESFEAVQKTQEEVRRKGEKFSGEAGMYCNLEAALKPNLQKQGFFKFLENYLLGAMAAKTMIRRHFEALSNPLAAISLSSS
ncbi:MAG TPA: aminotransferase class V-fold PLP-dependent enzyme [Chlamydiales bacterium]|nr:aminotransferase class V-fold PLP-dependent enzyme [Chlamydiales bacterium]